MLLNKYNLNLTERGLTMGFTLNQLEQERQIRKLQNKEDKDTKDYEKLTNLPKINGVTLTGNKTTSDLGIDKTAVGLSNVPNVSTNDQTPTFTEASTRNNIASGEKLSVIFGKIAKFFNDLKTVAFSGNASDLNYDNTDSGLTATKVQGAIDEVNSKLGVEKLLKEVTADGIKTYKDLLIELYTSANGYSGFAQLRIGDTYFNPSSKISFNKISYSSNAFHFEMISIGSTNASYHKGDMTDNGAWTHTNISTTVPSQGTKIRLYKCN